MRVAILHQALAPDAGPDERDVLDQLVAVDGALGELGHTTTTVPCSLDLSQVKAALAEARVELGFNLVESLDGRGSLIHLVPALLDAVSLPYTGARAEALWLTSNKLLAKERMRAAGLPVPAPLDASAGGLYVVKSVWEHASIGLDASSVVPAKEVPRLLEDRSRRFGGPFFAEAYVGGRELNVSLLEIDGEPVALPIAEIAFEGFEPAAPRIVGYDAKWDPKSFAYEHTPRVVPPEADDAPLMVRLRHLAVAAWRAFGVSGYARVDFRVADGDPTILEVNANPCLSPDAGFAAALTRAGIDYPSAIGHIVAAAAGAPCS